jgi:seryl-tRNA synthetase
MIVGLTGYVNRPEAQHAIQARQIRDLESRVDALGIMQKEQLASVSREIEGLRPVTEEWQQWSAEMKGEIVSEQSAELGSLKNANTKVEESLVGRIEELKQELRQLKEQLSPMEANRSKEVAGLREVIAEGSPKVQDEVTNVQQDVAKLEKDILVLTTEQDAPLELGLQFPPVLKRGLDSRFRMGSLHI